MPRKLVAQPVREVEMPYVFRRVDGSIRAHLMLTPTQAEKINLSRIEKGFLNGRWEPDPAKKPWAELDGIGAGKRASTELKQLRQDAASLAFFVSLLPPS